MLHFLFIYKFDLYCKTYIHVYFLHPVSCFSQNSTRTDSDFRTKSSGGSHISSIQVTVVADDREPPGRLGSERPVSPALLTDSLSFSSLPGTLDTPTRPAGSHKHPSDPVLCTQ